MKITIGADIEMFCKHPMCDDVVASKMVIKEMTGTTILFKCEECNNCVRLCSGLTMGIGKGKRDENHRDQG